MRSVPYAEIKAPRVVEDITTGQNPRISTELWRHSAYGVTAGAMIKGNRTDPNPWHYSVQDVRFLKGTNSYSSVYTSGTSRGQSVLLRQIGGIASDSVHKMFDVGPFPTYLQNAALSRLNEKVRGTLDLSVGLAQAGQTVRMFRASENARIFLTAFQGWRGLIKGLSDARLAFAYGWSPLASDLYNALDESIRVVINDIQSVRASASEAVPSSTEHVNVGYYGSAPVTMIRTGQFFAQYGMKYRTRGHNIDRWASLNPVSLAWELLPYSFVLDWVIDVGSYIRDLETSLLYANSFVNGYLTVGTMYDVTGTCNAFRRGYDSYSYKIYTVNAACSGRYRSLTRTRLSSYPAPRLPSFKADLGTGRLLNLASLIGSKLKVNPVR